MHRSSFVQTLLILFLTIPFLAIAQEKMITKDGKEYPATSNWEFLCPSYTYSGILNAQIAKTEKGGILKIGINVSDENFYIGDNVYLTLEDGSYIICTDKGIREMKEKQTIAYYFLTASEMNKLKIIQISNIRFQIKGNQDLYSSKTGHFTAINKKSTIEVLGIAEDLKTYNTKAALNSL
ncbi:hypothetical protein [Flavobacterium soli]|uniref:hypothetical protein n=1 Tax=Flavobacterium soli TaxID=344881 RepID=UPI000683EBD6|nr:hypothetical protein [Flavobacterium soli]